METLSILTIDDNDSIRLSIACYLEDMGYKVFEADSGEAGIKIMESESIDIILTDTHMPGLSGIDVLEYVVKKSPDIPVIIISGAGEIKYVVEALRAGAWDYITKPIEDLDFLTHSIERVVKRVRLIRENKEKSAEIERKNIELSESLEMLKRTQKQLVESEKMASLGHMVTGIAHEINTPLGVCITSVSYLFDQAESVLKSFQESKSLSSKDFEKCAADTRDLSGIIDSSLQTINSLVVNFKQLSMDSEGLSKIKFNLNDSIKSILIIVSSLYPNIDISINVTGGDFEINSYSEAINRVFTKLAENSIVHGFQDRDSGVIDVDIKTDGELISITLKNNGRLISENIIDNIFDPFFTENKNGGSGLGLSIVHNLVAFTLRGSVSCQNRDDGVSYLLSFPKDLN